MGQLRPCNILKNIWRIKIIFTKKLNKFILFVWLSLLYFKKKSKFPFPPCHKNLQKIGQLRPCNILKNIWRIKMVFTKKLNKFILFVWLSLLYFKKKSKFPFPPGHKNLQNFVYPKINYTPQPKSCYVFILDCIFGGDVMNTSTLCT